MHGCRYENGPYWIDQASNTLYQNKFSWNNISSACSSKCHSQQGRDSCCASAELFKPSCFVCLMVMPCFRCCTHYTIFGTNHAVRFASSVRYFKLPDMLYII